MNFETFLLKKRKEKKITKIQRNCFPDTLSDKFPANCTKNLPRYIISIPFFLISLYKIPF